MLNVERLIFHGDGLFNRDDVHAHTAAARRQQVCLAGKRHIGHAFKEFGEFRMLLQPRVAPGQVCILFHVEQFCAAGDEHGKNVAPLRLRRGAAIVVIVVTVVIFQQADVTHLIEQFLKMRLLLVRDLVHAPEFFDGIRGAKLHGQGNIGHFIRHDAGQTPVFCVARVQLAEFMLNNVGDLFAKLEDFLPGRGLVLGGRIQRALLQFLIDHKRVSFFSFSLQICAQIQAASASTPSPVLAEIGKICMSGLRCRANSVTLSRSKSKYGSTSVLLTIIAPQR